LCGKDGRFQLFLTHILPLRDPSGAINRWIGTHIDISEQKRREEHIHFIVDELSHRTRNLLAVVMAVAKQTARNAQNVAQYQAHFGDRLKALAHAHDVLVRGHWQGASFGDLVTAQMKPFREAAENHIHASGPAITLKPNAVQNLGLALHELATNASKHGALSVPQGEVWIQWHMNETTGRVRVHWRESGGPPVQPAQRRGFGHELIERIVPQALNGTGALSFAPAGIDWIFEFPAGRE
jgi:two-component sensor histidine kinase